MTQQRYLITGGAGFIGSHLAQALLARGAAVRIFDNLSSGRQLNLDALAGRAEFIQGDLRDLDAVRGAMGGMAVVFHEGAQVSVPRSVADPLTSLHTNVNGTQHVLLAAREAGVRRVVYASSCAVYGDGPEQPKREELPPRPLSPYAVEKLAGEHLCQLFTRLYGLETVALRYFNVFGPRQDPDSDYAAVIPRFLAALLAGRQPVVFGDGEQTRDFVYIEDVVQANLRAAEAPAAVGQVLNIGTGQSISLNQLLALLSDLLGQPVRPEYREPRPGDIRGSLADISRARQMLGYQPSVSVGEGLARTLDAMRPALRPMPDDHAGE